MLRFFLFTFTANAPLRKDTGVFKSFGNFIGLRQWFPTTVPRHISVPRNDYWCAAKRSSKQTNKKRNENILTATDKLVNFKKKIAIWKNRMKVDDLDMFPSVRKTCVTEMILIISEYLTCLENKIEEYFLFFFEDECCLYNKGSKSIQRNFC